MPTVRVLATGGAGFIGSHVAVELIQAGCEVVILDNFENSERGVLPRIGQAAGSRPLLVEADVRDRSALDQLFERHRVDAVIHLAGKKNVEESITSPLLYYDANISGTVALLRAMQAHRVNRLVFSSTAAVYGVPERLPIDEEAPVDPISPYGETKATIERIIDAQTRAVPALGAISLRYFNPVGAHPSGLIGESPLMPPTNLFPLLVAAAAGRTEALRVFGGDYPTVDGSPIRDFIHVVDLARGHVAALRRVLASEGGRHTRYNLGTGRGCTVLQAIQAFSQATGLAVPFHVAPRRAGDIVASVADPSRANAEMGWRATHGLAEMCADHWRYANARTGRSALACAG